MLYKKYHRRYIRKFKRKLSSKLRESDWTCFRGVFIDNSCIIVNLIQKEVGLVFSWTWKKRTVTIIKRNGELNKEIDNVIQEISQKPCKAV